MTARTQLRNAQSAIEEARRKLKRIRGVGEGDAEHQARRALRDLDDADSAINRAIRDIPLA